MAPGKECKGMPPLVTHVSTRAPVSISISARQVSSRSAPPAFCFPAAHSQNDLPCLQKKKTNTQKRNEQQGSIFLIFCVLFRRLRASLSLSLLLPLFFLFHLCSVRFFFFYSAPPSLSLFSSFSFFFIAFHLPSSSIELLFLFPGQVPLFR